MVTLSQVENTLLPFVGSSLLPYLEGPCETIVRALNSPREWKNLSRLVQNISVLLYGQIKQLTKGRMIVQPDSGYPVQMRTEDFAILTDDLLFLLFCDFPVDGEHLLFIRDFSMQEASLSALRALYTRFAPLQTEEELETIAHIARSCYPDYRLKSWLHHQSI